MNSQEELRGRLALAEKILCETPVVSLAHNSIHLYAKLEFLNGIGSIKDRPAFWILKRAIERGEIVPGTTVVESSSGNFASALSVFCRILGLRFIPVIDPVVPPVYENFLRAYCERVVKVEERDDTDGYLKTRLHMVRTLMAEIPGAYWPNQYGNPDGMAAHYQLTAAEICRAIPRLDYVFIGVSSAGTIAGVSCRLKEHYPGIRVIAVDAEGSVIFGQKPKRRQISGIGSSIEAPLVKEAIIDEIVIVPERDTVFACHQLLEQHSLFVGGSTGSAYSAIQSYFSDWQQKSCPSVLFLCCDRGSAYLHNVYNPRWVETNMKNSAATQLSAHSSSK